MFNTDYDPTTVPSFGFDPYPTNPLISCDHLELEQVQFGKNTMTTIPNISGDHAGQFQTSQSTTTSNFDHKVEMLNKMVSRLKEETEKQRQEITELHTMVRSSTDTGLKHGIAIQMIKDMSPEQSKIFLRALNAELHRLSATSKGKA